MSDGTGDATRPTDGEVGGPPGDGGPPPWYRQPVIVVPVVLVFLAVVALVVVAAGRGPDEEADEAAPFEEVPTTGDESPGEGPATTDEGAGAAGGPLEDAPAEIPQGRAGAGMETSLFSVHLSWENVVTDGDGPPGFGGGQVRATGTALVRLASEHGIVCADITVEGLDDDDLFFGGQGAHLHQGALAENGPVVVSFTTPDDETGQSSGCFTSFEEGFDPRETLRAIEENPESWYVDVHSAAFPAGVVRGQLPDGGQEDLPGR